MIRSISKAFSSVSPSIPIQSLGVVGSGQMGTGIAIVAAKVSKLRVKLMDCTEDRLSNSRKFAEKWLEKEVSKQKMTQDEMYDVLNRFTYTLHLRDFSDVNFVVEAVNENFELKKSIFQELDKYTKPETILASNTSSISITKIAATTQRPSQVIGMHFMNPVPVMALVEVITGLQTNETTLQAVKDLAKEMGKEIVLSKDYPGFIANRILMPYINEAVYALYEGVSSAEMIDKAMKMGTNVPMGPLTLADFIGLDTCLSIMEVLHEELGDSKYRPCPLLRNYVNAGYLGKKSGKGFYSY